MVNIHCLTLNLCCIVVTNIQVFPYRVSNLIGMKQNHVQQYVLMSIEAHYAVQCMVDDHTNNAQ